MEALERRFPALALAIDCSDRIDPGLSGKPPPMRHDYTIYQYLPGLSVPACAGAAMPGFWASGDASMRMAATNPACFRNVSMFRLRRHRRPARSAASFGLGVSASSRREAWELNDAMRGTRGLADATAVFQCGAAVSHSGRAHFILPPYYHPSRVENRGDTVDGHQLRGGVGDMYLLALLRYFTGMVTYRRYRPELHYMRGRGPKWHERHDR